MWQVWLVTPTGCQPLSGLHQAMSKRAYGEALCCPSIALCYTVWWQKATGTHSQQRKARHKAKGYYRGDRLAPESMQSPSLQMLQLDWKGSQQPNLGLRLCSETPHWGPPKSPSHYGSPPDHQSPRFRWYHCVPRQLWRMALITTSEYFLQRKPPHAHGVSWFSLGLPNSIYQKEFLRWSGRMLPVWDTSRWRKRK